MLLNLLIKNVAIIDELNIEFKKGLNVLTGETGAGKSIIIDSINVILGDRVSKDLIRSGKEKAYVEANFEFNSKALFDILEESGIEIESDGTLIISREVTNSGKNTCRVNGKMITVSLLKKIGEYLIDIHGQNDNQSLLKTDTHITILDSFIGNEISTIKNQYLKMLSNYKEIKSNLKEVLGNNNDRERKIDLLKYQLQEIIEAKLKIGEEEELEKQQRILSNIEKVKSSVSNAYECVCTSSQGTNSSLDLINNAINHINGISNFDETFVVILDKLKEISYQIEDISNDLRSQRDSAECEPNLLSEIEERLSLIFKLKKKYGNSIPEILDFCEKVKSELEKLENSEKLIHKLTKELDDVKDALYENSIKLNKLRQNAALELENKIQTQLMDLEMKNTKFKVNIEFEDDLNEQNERRFTQNGLDKIEFLISSNPGEPLKPLSKIASGGEMSRIMLAIKTTIANIDEVPTMIFDEIDIGISGKAAQKVSEKLSEISRIHQAICVTHLAQIACMADNHYMIEKVSKENTTSTFIRRLEQKDIEIEIARIIGGDNISETALKHAREMLSLKSTFKSG